MNMKQARVIVKTLFTSRSDVKINHFGGRDVILKDYTMPGVHMLLGWGSTWEEAINHSKQRLLEMNKRKRRSKQ